MINKTELNLLIELSKLVEKYGEEIFNNLVKNLKNESFVSDIEILAKTIPNIKPLTRKTKTTIDYKKKITSILTELKKNEIEKFNLLNIFAKKIDAKECFRTLKEFSFHLNEAGIFHKKIQTWPHGKFILISHLSKQNLSEIKRSISRINEFHRTEDRSLDAWSEVIFKGSKKD